MEDHLIAGVAMENGLCVDPVGLGFETVVAPESWKTSLCGFPVGGRGVLVADGAHHAVRAVPAVVVVEAVAPVQDNGLGPSGVVELVA